MPQPAFIAMAAWGMRCIVSFIGDVAPLPVYSASGLRRLSFPQVRLARGMPLVRRQSEAHRRRYYGLRGGRNEQIPERKHRHLATLLFFSCCLILAERWDISFGYRHVPPHRFPIPP